jgi:hypothetical protein
LPSVGELFTAMDVPAFMTNDDVTPYVLPCIPQIQYHLLVLNKALATATRSAPLEISAMWCALKAAGHCEITYP